MLVKMMICNLQERNVPRTARAAFLGSSCLYVLILSLTIAAIYQYMLQRIKVMLEAKILIYYIQADNNRYRDVEEMQIQFTNPRECRNEENKREEHKSCKTSSQLLLRFARSQLPDK